MDNEKQIQELLKKFIRNECTLEELEQIKVVLKAGTYDHLWNDLIQKDAIQQIINKQDFNKTINNKHAEIFQKISRTIEINETKNNVAKLQRRRRIITIAAAISFVFISYLVSINFFNSPVQEPQLIVITTDPGQKKMITLPDNSIVRLNAGSRLEYAANFNQESREVTLNGEAYFKISKNKAKPFAISTGNYEVDVVGTAFNLNNYSSDKPIAISVTEGIVRFSYPDKKGFLTDTLVTANQHLTFDGKYNELDIENFDSEFQIAWLENLLIFENEPLENVIEKLELWYGVIFIVEIEQIEKCRFSGRFKNESLEFILQSIEMVSDLQYEMNDNHVKLKGKGCL